MARLKEFFKKVDFEKNQQTTKMHEKCPSVQRIKADYRDAMYVSIEVEVSVVHRVS